MSDFVLPDVKEGIENLIDMQQHFAEEKDETDYEKKSEEIQEKEDTKLPEYADAAEETNQSEEIKETKEKYEGKSSVNVETKDQ